MTGQVNYHPVISIHIGKNAVQNISETDRVIDRLAFALRLGSTWDIVVDGDAIYVNRITARGSGGD